MSSNPMTIHRPRSPPSPSSNSGTPSSTSTSVKSSMSTPPRSAMYLSSRNSLTMSLTNHGHGLSSLPNNNANGANDGDIPFLGTPFAFARERPYEYPFPSPATESCPNLAATSPTMGTMGLGLVHVPPPSAFLAQSSSQSQPQSALPSVLPPPVSPIAPNAFPASSNSIGPFATRMPLRRRSSYAQGGMAMPSPPVPPSLSNKASRRTSVNGGRNVTRL
jgi:hypothetical protein